MIVFILWVIVVMALLTSTTISDDKRLVPIYLIMLLSSGLIGYFMHPWFN